MNVSIITATYNSADFILDTYNSIKNQTYKNWEWIVTDDCSSDNTPLILKEIQKKDDRLTIYFNTENSGAAVSRNNSISKSSGLFLAFLDADDLWQSDKLSMQLKFMDKEIDFSFTAFQLMTESGAKLNKFIDLDNRKKIFSYDDALKKRATFGCSTVVLRKGAFADLNMPLIRTGQDYAFWLKLLKDGNSAYLIDISLTQYRIVKGSISRNKYHKAKRQWHIYRKLESLSFVKSTICFINYSLRAIFR